MFLKYMLYFECVMIRFVQTVYSTIGISRILSAY